jgi:hypothetical protein
MVDVSDLLDMFVHNPQIEANEATYLNCKLNYKIKSIRRYASLAAFQIDLFLCFLVVVLKTSFCRSLNTIATLNESHLLLHESQLYRFVIIIQVQNQSNFYQN